LGCEDEGWIHLTLDRDIARMGAKGKGLLGKPRRRWEDNIKINLKEVGCEDVGWIHLTPGKDQ